MRTVAIDPQRKHAALQRAAEVGPKRASEETGISASTIRAWRTRSTEVAPAEAIKSATEVEQVYRMAKKATDTAEEAIDRVRELLPTAKGVQSLSIATGVLVDKARMLADVGAALDERTTRMSEQDAQVILEALHLSMEAVGLEWSRDLRRLFAGVLRTLPTGVMVASPEDAEPARREVREFIRREIEPELRRELEVEIRARLEAEAREAAMAEPARLALPPAGGTSTMPPGSMGAPRKAWVATAPERPASPSVSPRPSSRGRLVRTQSARNSYGDSEFS